MPVRVHTRVHVLAHMPVRVRKRHCEQHNYHWPVPPAACELKAVRSTQTQTVTQTHKHSPRGGQSTPRRWRCAGVVRFLFLVHSHSFVYSRRNEVRDHASSKHVEPSTFTPSATYSTSSCCSSSSSTPSYGVRPMRRRSSNESSFWSCGDKPEFRTYLMLFKRARRDML